MRLCAAHPAGIVADVASYLQFELRNGKSEQLSLGDHDPAEELNLWEQGAAPRYSGEWLRVDGGKLIRVSEIVSVEVGEGDAGDPLTAYG